MELDGKTGSLSGLKSKIKDGGTRFKRREVKVNVSHATGSEALPRTGDVTTRAGSAREFKALFEDGVRQPLPPPRRMSHDQIRSSNSDSIVVAPVFRGRGAVKSAGAEAASLKQQRLRTEDDVAPNNGEQSEPPALARGRNSSGSSSTSHGSGSKSSDDVRSSALKRGSSDRGSTGSVDKAANGGARSREVEVVEWRCSICDKACIPVRSESRCICGHRLKDHPSTHTRNNKAGTGRSASSSSSSSSAGGGSFKPWACTSARCPCPRFKFIMAEGAWILRCRCKHKHTDHEAVSPYLCKKPECSSQAKGGGGGEKAGAVTACNGFDSPFVCNCDHGWSDHQQIFVRKVFSSPFDAALVVAGNSGMDMSDLGQVQRTDLKAAPMNVNVGRGL